MPKSSVRAGIYAPPSDMLPYVGLVITPQGKQQIATFWDEKSAIEFVEKHQKNYVEQLSVVGKGIRGDAPSSGD